MPRVSRSRELAAPPEEVWRLVSDPHHLPRWWPRTTRVEDVEATPQIARTRFTQVLETGRGKPVRADFRVTAATSPRRLVFEQELEGTPFDRFMRSYSLEVGLAERGSGTSVTLTTEQKMRGMSRFGGLMVRSAARRTLSSALDGLEEALGAAP